MATQAQTRTLVLKHEKKIRKAEKALEDKKPDMIDLDAKIKHSERKLEKAEIIDSQVAKDRDDMDAKLKRMNKELVDVKKDADDVQSKYFTDIHTYRR